MRIRFPLILALPVALLFAALPSPAQPPPDLASLLVRLFYEDGTTFNVRYSVALLDPNGTQVAPFEQPTQQANCTLFVGVAAGDYTLVLTSIEVPGCLQRNITLTAGANTVDLNMRDWNKANNAGTLTIKVTTADGTDLKTGVSFTVRKWPGGDVTDTIYPTVSGSMFTLKFHPGGYRLVVNQHGVGALDSRDVFVTPGSHTLDWKLPPSASFTVNLVDKGQVARSGLMFSLTLKRADDGMVGPGDTIAAAGNSITLTGVSVGTYTAQLSTNDTIFDQRAVTIAPGDNTLDWELLSPATLAVTLADPTHAWFVTLQREGYPDVTRSLQANLDLTFTDLAATHYTLLFKLATYPAQMVEKRDITLTPGANTLAWTPPPLATVTFHVLMADGQPPTNRVILSLKRVTDGAFLENGRDSATIAGEETFTNVPLGVYHGKLGLGGLTTLDEQDVTIVAGEQTIAWHVPVFPTLTGALLADGQPVTPTRGFIALPFGTVTRALPDLSVTFSDGHYTIAHVRLDVTRMLLLTDAGWAVTPLKLVAGVESVDLPLVLQPGGKLEVTGIPVKIVANRGQVPGYITLTSTDMTLRLPPLTFYADANGVVSLPSLPPGVWQYVIINSSQGVVKMGDVDIEPYTTQTLAVPVKTLVAGG